MGTAAVSLGTTVLSITYTSLVPSRDKMTFYAQVMVMENEKSALVAFNYHQIQHLCAVFL